MIVMGTLNEIDVNEGNGHIKCNIDRYIMDVNGDCECNILRNLNGDTDCY